MKNGAKIIYVGFGICILVLFYLKLSSSDKVVYINEAIVNQKYQGIIDARKIMEQRSKILQANIDTLTNEFKNAIAQYEKDREKMSEKEIKLNQELLGNKQQQLTNYSNEIQKKIGDEQKKIFGEIYSNIDAFIGKYAKAHNYKLVLGANILYGDPEIDITETIIEYLNKEYEKTK